MLQYVNVSFHQMQEDWNTGKVTFSNHSARRCEPKDFGDDEQSKHLYDLWISDAYYFDIFCPDLFSKDLTFYSEEGENLVQSMIFQIEKCQPERNPPGFCKSDAEIEEYIRDLQVQLFVVEQSHDLQKRHGETLKKTQTLVSDTALYLRQEIPHQYVTLSQTLFHSSEGLFGEFQPTHIHDYNYYTLDRVISSPQARMRYKNQILMKTKVYLSKKRTQIYRSLYDLLMLMSQFGGFIKIANVMTFSAVVPIIRYLFFMVMIKRLYFAKTE